MREVIVYSRYGCHLCEAMLEQIEPHCRGRATVVVRDVDTDPEWIHAYGLDVPVLVLDGREVCRHRLDVTAFLKALEA